MSNNQFKAGDKVKCIDNSLLQDYFTLGETCIVSRIPYKGHLCFNHTGEACWHSDRFELIEKEDTVKENKQFNPQPGDKIICNNGEEYTCCTLEYLQDEGFALDYSFYTNTVFGVGLFWPDSGTWMYWNLSKLYTDIDWNIREVIPKQKEETSPVKVEQEMTYTTEDIHSVWTEMKWSEETYEQFKKMLKKMTSPEYKEYLRLKSMFEPVNK